MSRNWLSCLPSPVTPQPGTQFLFIPQSPPAVSPSRATLKPLSPGENQRKATIGAATEQHSLRHAPPSHPFIPMFSPSRLPRHPTAMGCLREGGFLFTFPAPSTNNAVPVQVFRREKCTEPVVPISLPVPALPYLAEKAFRELDHSLWEL